MDKMKFTRLVGLKEEHFLNFIDQKRIIFSEAKLIPLLKTGDEMALTSIFLSSIRLVKEYRYTIFNDLKIPKVGKFYYLTEVKVPEISEFRFDGMIIVIKSGKIVDATIFEVKKENNHIEEKQIKKYIDVAIKLKIPRLVTISNQFVSDSTQLPIDIKYSNKIKIFHFSWTYLLTKARILLFENDINIEDPDQVEIMREVLHYLENKKSGVKGYTMMDSSWKLLTEKILTNKQLNENDSVLLNAVLSWYQEEKDMSLLLSKELGMMVKSKSRNKDSILKDIKDVIKTKSIVTSIKVADSVSSLKIKASFEKKTILMEVEIKPPENETNIGKINWLIKQIKSGQKRNKKEFKDISNIVFITAIIKFSKNKFTEALNDYNNLKEINKANEIKSFKLYTVRDLGRSYTSAKGFIKEIEFLLLEFYGGYVQHLSNWTKPAPKIERD